MKFFLALFLLISSSLICAEKLRIYEEETPEAILHQTSDFDEIVAILASVGVQFERWEVTQPLSTRPAEEEIFNAYNQDIERIMALNSYRTVDVIRMFPETPNKNALRTKFLREHTHEEDEVRLFVEGEGLFYLHIEDKVYIVLCEKGELISIPAHYRHWFDMGEFPYFIALRFFIEPNGWIAQFTGSDIGNLFPRHEAKRVEAIVVDIEGTTTSLEFVHDILFPYAREKIPSYIEEHQDDPAVALLIEDVKQIAKRESDNVVEILLEWMNQDLKITPLKAVQGLIWEEGYFVGALKGHIYQDAVEQLKAWNDSGRKLYVYSSGSVKAQQLLFAHTQFGDLTPLFSGFFDTRIGPKKEEASYQKIAESIALNPARILFLSDSIDEVKAASAAGMQVMLVAREQDPIADTFYPVVHNFEEVVLP